MKKALLIATLSLVACISASAFGRRSHAAVTFIAEQHLTPKAAATINEILDGKTMTYYSSWLDDYKKVETYPNGKSFPHAMRADEDLNPVLNKPNSALYLIGDAVSKLRNYKDLDDSTRLQCMKQLAHDVGDTHCPVHVHFKDGFDKNLGKYMILDHKGREHRLHTYLDESLLDTTVPGGVRDLAEMCDPTLRPNPCKADFDYMKEVQKGTLDDWGRDIIARTRCVYEIAPEGYQISLQERQRFIDIELEQIRRAGYRLAYILNDLFGK